MSYTFFSILIFPKRHVLPFQQVIFLLISFLLNLSVSTNKQKLSPPLLPTAVSISQCPSSNLLFIISALRSILFPPFFLILFVPLYCFLYFFLQGSCQLLILCKFLYVYSYKGSFHIYLHLYLPFLLFPELHTGKFFLPLLFFR